MDKERKKQLAWGFWKIQNQEEAIHVINQTAQGFIILGFLQMIAGMFLGVYYIIGGGIYLLLAFLLWSFRSRVIALILLLMSIGGMVVTFENVITQQENEGSNIYLAVIIFYAAIASAYATFKFYKMKK